MTTVTERRTQPGRTVESRLGRPRESGRRTSFTLRAGLSGRDSRGVPGTMPNGDPPPVMLWGEDKS
ncbi:MAG: hypothetical protein HQ559_18505 [Lentisphaerae bacterium]|nr:hypothetical protein [Lentisphaerota bacterium]